MFGRKKRAEAERLAKAQEEAKRKQTRREDAIRFARTCGEEAAMRAYPEFVQPEGGGNAFFNPYR